MTKFDDHPTVKRLRELQKSQGQNPQNTASSPLDRDWLRSFCLDLGVDDVGFVSIDQPEMAEQRTASIIVSVTEGVAAQAGN